MVGFTPQRRRSLSRLGGMTVMGAGLMLAGCSGTTYGTGTTPGLQTVQDLVGIAALSPAKREPIDYTPRPKVVLPPTVAALPPPGTADAATPADWPHDPDAAVAKIRADTAAREASGAPTPQLKLPAGPPPATGSNVMVSSHVQGDGPGTLTADEQAKVKKLFADARGGVAFDANGNPVRRYLTDPPPDYRVPDPTAPVEFTPKKKKFHWWWQKQDDSADDGLTPSTTTATATADSPKPPN